MISVNSGGVKIQKYLWIQHLWIKRDKVSTVEVSLLTSKIVYWEPLWGASIKVHHFQFTLQISIVILLYEFIKVMEKMYTLMIGKLFCKDYH